jgi:ankyrin repeat protein
MTKKHRKPETLGRPRRGLFRGGIYSALLQGGTILAIAIVIVYLLILPSGEETPPPGAGVAEGTAPAEKAAFGNAASDAPKTLEAVSDHIDILFAEIIGAFDPADPDSREYLQRLITNAAAGYVDEQFLVGEFYLAGMGVKKNEKLAAELQLKSAEKKLVDAQLRMGSLYALGRGVPFNAAHAHMWWTLAADFGDTLAAQSVQLIRPMMTHTDYSESARQALVFKQLWDSWQRFAIINNPQLSSQLLAAARAGNAVRIRRLLDQGANPNIKDRKGRAALLLSAKGGHGESAQALLSRGADANATDENGKSVLMYAAENGDGKLVKALLQRKVNVNAANKFGETALINAAWRGRKSVASTLIDRGAEVDLPDKQGGTALIWAAINGHTQVLDLLVDRNTQINWIDNSGLTALSRASWNGEIKAVKTLLDHGANPLVRDKEGMTAAIRAESEGYSDIVSMLSQATRGG